MLLEQRTMRENFRFPITDVQAQTFLKAAYKFEVYKRGINFVDDERTNNHINELAKFLTSKSQKFGIMICGTYGNGKTTLVKCLQTAIGLMASKDILDVRTHLEIYKEIEIIKLHNDYERYRNVCRKDLLAIDDLGNESTEVVNYGNITYPVVEMLEFRYDERLFTVITSNLTPSQIRKKYGDRIADRFNEMMFVINYKDEKTYRGA